MGPGVYKAVMSKSFPLPHYYSLTSNDGADSPEASLCQNLVSKGWSIPTENIIPTQTT